MNNLSYNCLDFNGWFRDIHLIINGEHNRTTKRLNRQYVQLNEYKQLVYAIYHNQVNNVKRMLCVLLNKEDNNKIITTIDTKNINDMLLLISIAALNDSLDVIKYLLSLDCIYNSICYRVHILYQSHVQKLYHVPYVTLNLNVLNQSMDNTYDTIYSVNPIMAAISKDKYRILYYLLSEFNIKKTEFPIKQYLNHCNEINAKNCAKIINQYYS